MELLAVRLDRDKLPKDDSKRHALQIAGALLELCSLATIWDEPKYGQRLYYVKEIPQDVPQAGVYWIKVDDVPTYDYKPFEGAGKANE